MPSRSPCPTAPSRCRLMSRPRRRWRAASPRSASWPTKRPAALWRRDLLQGQRLVSRDGALWRWDGFTVAAGAPTAAAVRLRQRNRLAELTARARARPNEILREAEAGLHRGAQRRARRHRRGRCAARQALQAAYRAAAQARQARDRSPGPRRPARRPALGPRSGRSRPPMPSLAESEQRKRRRGRGALASARSRRGRARRARRAARPLLAEKRGHSSNAAARPSACGAKRRPGASA